MNVASPQLRPKMITAGKHEVQSDRGTTAETIRGKFAEHHKELRWLAGFLTGDDAVAEACVIDACATAESFSEALSDGLDISPTFATIYSTIQMHRSRIAELSPAYESRAYCTHEQLPAASLEFIVIKSDVIRCRLDTLCRFALVMCAIEKCLPSEAAQWLGISQLAVEAAYCAALESLQVINCEMRSESDAVPAVWN